MKQQISLNPSTDTIHVDDVRVEDGVYFKTKPECIDEDMKHDCWIWFLVKKGDELVSVSPKNLNEKWNSYKSLPDAIKYESDGDFFTLSGLRIVTEKALTVADLKNSDFIGLVDSCNMKWQVVPAIGGVNAISSKYGLIRHSEDYKDIQSLIDDSALTTAYRFTTAQELHKWLGEDEG